MTFRSLRLCLVVPVLAALSACGYQEVSEESMERYRKEREAVPGSPYARELALAQEHHRARDGFSTRLVAEEGETQVEILKKPNGRDDGPPGVASGVRERLDAGRYVLVIDSTDVTGTRMWKVTDGDVVGWVPTGRLEKRPVAVEVPDPGTVALGPGVEWLTDFTASPLCATYGCSLFQSRELPEGRVANDFAVGSGTGWYVQVQTEGRQVTGGRLHIIQRARREDGRSRLRFQDAAFANAFVRTLLGETCPAAERLVEESFGHPTDDRAAAPSARCGEWTVRAGQEETRPTLVMRRGEEAGDAAPGEGPSPAERSI